jgi:hypothetical protein
MTSGNNPKLGGRALVPATPQQVVPVTGDLETSIQGFNGHKHSTYCHHYRSGNGFSKPYKHSL